MIEDAVANEGTSRTLGQYAPLMRLLRLLLPAALLTACEPTGVSTETVDLTLRLRLAGDRDVGSTPARVWVFVDTARVPRAFAFPQFAEPCLLDKTPVTTCTFAVRRFAHVSLIVSEPDPAVFVRFEPGSDQDTVRDGRFVEFTGWTECPDQAERGHCLVRPRAAITIEGNFQLLQQVTVYQTGVARLDYRMFSAAPTLKVPAQNDNILDLVGCVRQVLPPTPACDSIRLVADAPFHRFTAYVSRQTIVGMFTHPGADTELVGWDGDCIQSGIYGPGTCSLISPSVSGAPIRITAKYTWWLCPTGISDRNSGGCVLQGVDEGTAQRASGKAH